LEDKKERGRKSLTRPKDEMKGNSAHFLENGLSPPKTYKKQKILKGG